MTLLITVSEAVYAVIVVENLKQELQDGNKRNFSMNFRPKVGLGLQIAAY